MITFSACAHEQQPSEPVGHTNTASTLVQSQDDYARFEADIVTTIFIDSTSLEQTGRLQEKEPERLRAFRQGARRPRVAAYHFAFLDSAGTVSVVMSPPSEAVTRGDAPATFLDWKKITEIRMAAGTVPEITLRDGNVIAAIAPADVAGGNIPLGQAKGMSRAGARAVASDGQLRSMLRQYVRLTPTSPESRRQNATRDSLQSNRGTIRRWEPMNAQLEVNAHREIQSQANPGRSGHRLVVDVRNPRVAGSVARLAVEE